MGYTRILVPLDGTAFGELALQHIPRLADPGAKIHLLSVVVNTVSQMIALSQEMWPPIVTNDLEEREVYLKAIANQLKKKGYDVTTEVKAGQPIGAIAVCSNGFDLIVMATHGRSGLTRFILGSVSEGVLHEAYCPVLIV